MMCTFRMALVPLLCLHARKTGTDHPGELTDLKDDLILKTRQELLHRSHETLRRVSLDHPPSPVLRALDEGIGLLGLRV